MSKSCNRKERVTVRLTPGQMQCLKELSTNLNTSYSLLIRSIIQDFICRNEDTLERIIINKQLEDANTELKKKTKKEINQRNEHTPNRELRQKYYNTTEWRKLREAYLKQHPVCEECLNKGKVTPATSVHHIQSPFKNGECNKNLFLDYNNLMAVCHECHAEIHNKEQGHIPVEEVIKQLADLLNPEIKDEDLE